MTTYKIVKNDRRELTAVLRESGELKGIKTNLCRSLFNLPIFPGKFALREGQRFFVEITGTERQEKGYLPLQVAVCNSALTNKYSESRIEDLKLSIDQHCIKSMSKGN